MHLEVWSGQSIITTGSYSLLSSDQYLETLVLLLLVSCPYETPTSFFILLGILRWIWIRMIVNICNFVRLTSHQKEILLWIPMTNGDWVRCFCPKNELELAWIMNLFVTRITIHMDSYRLCFESDRIPPPPPPHRTYFEGHDTLEVLSRQFSFE